jgi:choline transport protein
MICKRVKREPVRMGPWTLGKFGLPINIIAAVFLIISTLFSFFPPAIPVTLVTINWSCVVFGGVVIIGLVYYVLLGRHVYRSPIIERPILLTDQTPSPELEGPDKF